MFKNLFSLYRPSFARNIAYMLQASEYDGRMYLKWLHKTKDFSKVSTRKQFVRTSFSNALYLVLVVGIILQTLIGLVVMTLGFTHTIIGGQYYGLAIILIYPLLWPYFILVLVQLAKYFILWPRYRVVLSQAEEVFKNHPGTIIAVLGSYGKTSMKEFLKIVLSEGLNVAASPANKNVALSHAKFARSLSGKEDIVIVEYGEGKNGDIAELAKLTHPDIAVITGLAPAHQNHYKNIKQQADDLLSITSYVQAKNIYLNLDNFFKDISLPKSILKFDDEVVGDLKIKNVEVFFDKTTFDLVKGKDTMSYKTNVIGFHQVKYLALVCLLASKFGLSNDQIKRGIAKTKAFSHRMEPYLINGAKVIDDSYNGNIEGIKAGLNLLKKLDAKRKIYVTPGLVDQGKDSNLIHHEMGKLIAKANPDIVVLMKNSTTDSIKAGLDDEGFNRQLIIEDKPLDFYNNLTAFVAQDDLVLMQNDWPDNYK